MMMDRSGGMGKSRELTLEKRTIRKVPSGIQAGSLVGSILSDRKGEPILPMLAQVCS